MSTYSYSHLTNRVGAGKSGSGRWIRTTSLGYKSSGLPISLPPQFLSCGFNHHLPMPPIVRATAKAAIVIVSVFARQAIVWVWVQVRPQLVRSDLPIGGFRHWDNKFTRHAFFSAVEPLPNAGLACIDGFCSGYLTTNNIDSFFKHLFRSY